MVLVTQFGSKVCALFLFPWVLFLDYWLKFEWWGKLNVGWLREFNEETRKSQCLFFRCYVCVLSHVWLFVTPWTVAHQAPLSIEFFRWECWNGLPFLSSGDLTNPGIEPKSPVSSALQTDSLPTEPSGKSSLGLGGGFLKTKFIGQGFLSAHWGVFKDTNAWDTPAENRLNYLGQELSIWSLDSLGDSDMQLKLRISAIEE